jgi:hypothetical protein
MENQANQQPDIRHFSSSDKRHRSPKSDGNEIGKKKVKFKVTAKSIS